MFPESEFFMDVDNRKNNKKFVGKIGEGVACRFLENKGFSIVGRNYLKKWGEIDIIAKKAGIIRFVEVKSVSRENIEAISQNKDENKGSGGSYRPEDNIHPWKIKRLSRAINSYLLDNNVPETTEWQMDLVTVYLSPDLKRAKVFILENIVL